MKFFAQYNYKKKQNEFDNAIFVIAKEKRKNSEAWFDETQMECVNINIFFVSIIAFQNIIMFMVI